MLLNNVFILVIWYILIFIYIVGYWCWYVDILMIYMIYYITYPRFILRVIRLKRCESWIRGLMLVEWEWLVKLVREGHFNGTSYYKTYYKTKIIRPLNVRSKLLSKLTFRLHPLFATTQLFDRLLVHNIIHYQTKFCKKETSRLLITK